MLKILNAVLITLIFWGCCRTNQSPTNDVVDFSGTLTQQEIEGGVLTPEILWKFGRVAGGILSPDAKKVLYTVTRYNAETQKKTSNVFVCSIDGSNAEKLTEDRFIDMAPSWNNNGSKVYFLSNRYGTMQLWVMNSDGSERIQITDVADGINAYQLSPDNKMLWYTADVKLEESVVEKYPELSQANAIEADDLMYRHWDSWTDYKFSHIFVADLTNKIITSGADIMEGEKFDAPLAPYFDESEVTWAPNSKFIAYTSKKLYGREYAVSTNSDIYLYNLDTKETKDLTTTNKGYDKYPVFSPDGSKLAYMSMETPGYESDKERLMVLDLATGNNDYINQNWDRNAHAYQWSANGKEIFFISGDKATYQIFKVNIDDKTFTAVTSGQHDYTQFSKVDNVIVGAKMNHQLATELFVIDAVSGKEKQLTNVNARIYQNINMGHTEERWVKTTDSKEMLVWVVYPPNFDSNKKYPTLLYCQGGPQSTVSQFFSYRWNFAIMAANGYIVVAPNRRGLPSFGEEWNAQISTDYYGQNMKDYLSAIDDVAKEPYVDRDHIGAVGASYGGFSVFYLAGIHQKRFKAFIAHCGMFNMESFYAETEEPFFPNHDLGGAYWETDNKIAQASYEHSPHKMVQNWDTPIMIITGGNDFRIPYTESLQAFNAAQLRGIPSRLLFFPEESHFVLKPQNSILWQHEFFNWLDKYLK